MSDQPAAFDERDLVARIQAGEPAACEALVREEGGRLLAVARRFLPNEHDAQDALQDAFASAFASIASFEGEAKLSTWLHRIVVNACLMKIRSRKARKEVPIEGLLPSFLEDGHHVDPPGPWREDAFEQASSAELRRQIRNCIDQLPDAYRTILILRDIEERDTEETARLLGTTTSNVKVRLHRARQALRTLLDPILREEAA